MPTEAEHEAAYRANAAFLAAGGLAAAEPRWAAIAAFYAAVHLVERLAARDGVHNQRHVGNNSRQLYLSGHPQHAAVLPDLTALRVASELARYDSLDAFQAAYPPGTVQWTLIAGCLARIEAHVAAAVGPPPAAGS